MPIKKRKIDVFRKKLIKNVGSGFLIRGDMRKNRFKQKKNVFVSGKEVPAYFISPKYNQSSYKWMKQVQATVYATVYRSIRSKIQYFPAISKYNPKKENVGLLPTIQVFKSDSFPKSNNLLFNLEYFPNRKSYEKASVHGKIKPTFKEATLGRNFIQTSQKIFEVRLTKKEYVGIINKITTDLKKVNPNLSLLDLWQTRVGDVKSKNYAQKLKAFYKISKLKSFEAFESETTTTSLGSYLFYMRVSKIMTNKFVKKAIDYLEKQSK